MSVFLKIQLLFSLVVFLSQIALEYIKEVRVLLFSGALVGVVLCTLGITLLSLPQPAPVFPLEKVTYPAPAALTQTYTLPEFNTQLTTYLSIISVQPTHRDVLINTALLYQAQHNPEKAHELWLAAQQIDPNNPLFLYQLETDQL